uniref:Uncharacterized protein n=1 Tax=Salix viminalis TaxID=40686 RepID=A0A6N2NGZ4_SALVM
MLNPGKEIKKRISCCISSVDLDGGEVPGNTRRLEFSSFTTNGKAIAVHTLIFFVIFTILILALGIRIYTG